MPSSDDEATVPPVGEATASVDVAEQTPLTQRDDGASGEDTTASDASLGDLRGREGKPKPGQPKLELPFPPPVGQQAKGNGSGPSPSTPMSPGGALLLEALRNGKAQEKLREYQEQEKAKLLEQLPERLSQFDDICAHLDLLRFLKRCRIDVTDKDERDAALEEYVKTHYLKDAISDEILEAVTRIDTIADLDAAIQDTKAIVVERQQYLLAKYPDLLTAKANKQAVSNQTCRTTGRGTIIFASIGLAHILGVDNPDDLIGVHPFSLVLDADVAISLQAMKAVESVEPVTSFNNSYVWLTAPIVLNFIDGSKRVYSHHLYDGIIVRDYDETKDAALEQYSEYFRDASKRVYFVRPGSNQAVFYSQNECLFQFIAWDARVNENGINNALGHAVTATTCTAAMHLAFWKKYSVLFRDAVVNLLTVTRQLTTDSIKLGVDSIATAIAKLKDEQYRDGQAILMARREIESQMSNLLSEGNLSEDQRERWTVLVERAKQLTVREEALYSASKHALTELELMLQKISGDLGTLEQYLDAQGEMIKLFDKEVEKLADSDAFSSAMIIDDFQKNIQKIRKQASDKKLAPMPDVRKVRTDISLARPTKFVYYEDVEMVNKLLVRRLKAFKLQGEGFFFGHRAEDSVPAIFSKEKTGQVEVDICYSDWDMPAKKGDEQKLPRDGIICSRTLREAFDYQGPLIILTARSAKQAIEDNIYEDGYYDGYLGKPVIPEVVKVLSDQALCIYTVLGRNLVSHDIARCVVGAMSLIVSGIQPDPEADPLSHAYKLHVYFEKFPLLREMYFLQSGDIDDRLFQNHFLETPLLTQQQVKSLYEQHPLHKEAQLEAEQIVESMTAVCGSSQEHDIASADGAASEPQHLGEEDGAGQATDVTTHQRVWQELGDPTLRRRQGAPRTTDADKHFPHAQRTPPRPASQKLPPLPPTRQYSAPNLVGGTAIKGAVGPDTPALEGRGMPLVPQPPRERGRKGAGDGKQPGRRSLSTSPRQGT